MEMGYSLDVSVIMPAYNVERTIDGAIQSVLRQEGISFELIIGDDASTDRTWHRIENYRSDPRIHAWRFPRNRGPAFIRNRLGFKAKGRYLSICDADDELLSGNLRTLAEILGRDPSIGVVSPYWKYMDGQGAPIPVSAWPHQLRSPREWWDLLGGVGSHGGSLIRRSVFEKVGGYRKNLSGAEDPDLFLRLAEAGSCAEGEI